MTVGSTSEPSLTSVSMCVSQDLIMTVSLVFNVCVCVYMYIYVLKLENQPCLIFF